MSEGPRGITRYIVLLAIALYAVIVLKNAWIGDDAYITFRTIDNFIHGYGLTWNIIERVQVYTHPLWMMLLTIVYFFTREVFYTTITVSVILSLAAVVLYAFRLSASKTIATVGVLAMLLSGAFVDYSTSGLENPLTYLLLALFLYRFFIFMGKGPAASNKKNHVLILSLIAALGTLNRLDTILLYAPMLAYTFWQCRGWRAIKSIFIGFLPLIAWELFSFVYYGFFIPNTAYAKLETGLPHSWYWTQGWYYLESTVLGDPLTLAVIIGAIIIAFASRRARLVLPAIGIVLYMVYTVYIGGSFMAGRYYAAPFFIGIILLSQLSRLSKTAIAAALVAIIGTSLLGSRCPLYASSSDELTREGIFHGIVDERAASTPTHSLINYTGHGLAHEWAREGQEARDKQEPFLVHYAMGYLGYFAGPQTTILDVNALTDPLLARLPLKPGIDYRIGHFTRIVPPGYTATLMDGVNKIAHPSLAQYYDKLAEITRGDIWDMARLRTAIEFNLGSYDYLRDDYLLPHMIHLRLDDIDTPQPEGLEWRAPWATVIDSMGIEIVIGSVSHARQLEITRDYNDILRFVFLKNDTEVASFILPGKPIRSGGLAQSLMYIPDAAVEHGFDAIRIFPLPGDGQYSIGHVRLLDDEKKP